MRDSLEAIHDGQRVGRMSYASDEITFAYDKEWQGASDAFPISLSMPLARREHRDNVVRPFVSGLLPDDDEVRDRWGKRFHVSPRNPFRLLKYIGEECAGAVQFVAPERCHEWLSDDPPQGIAWLSDAEFEQRISDLLDDSSRARRMGDEGHFSLAGAQAKTALYRDPESGRWGIPKGITPTTHIIKPNRGDFEAFEINEHFCLQLATHLGIPAAKSWAETVGGVRVLIVERYDRARVDGRLIRIHQEDTCQSLARVPEDKYENEGGPSAKEIFDLIRENSSRPQDDALRFLDALILNYLIGGTDAHAKNYSFLIAGGGQVRLARLYDVISILPYPHEPRRVRLAMKIGRDYQLWKIGAQAWKRAAGDWKLDRDFVFGRIVTMAQELPGVTEAVGSRIACETATERDVLDRLMAGIAEHAGECLHLFSTT